MPIFEQVRGGVLVNIKRKAFAALQKHGILNREGTKGGRWIIVAK